MRRQFCASVSGDTPTPARLLTRHTQGWTHAAGQELIAVGNGRVTAYDPADGRERWWRKAHERGDVVKSQEVNAWFVLAAAGLVLLTFSGPMSTQLTATFRGILENSWRISAVRSRPLREIPQSRGLILSGG